MSNDQDSRQLHSQAAVPREAPVPHTPHAARAQTAFAFLILDIRGQIVFGSPDATHLLGAQDKPLIGQSVAQFIPALPLQQDTSGYNMAYIGFWAHGDHWQLFQAHHAPIEIRFNRLELAGQPYVTLELRTPEPNSPQQTLHKLMQAMDSSSECVAITNPAGEMTYVNRAFEQLTGYRRDEALGRSHDLLGADQSPELYAQMWATLRAGKPFHSVFINRHKNGQPFHEERSIRPFIDRQGRTTHYIFTGRDVSDRERVIQRLEHLANHDALTGLPNRNLFMDRLRQATTHAVRRNSGFSLLLLDLDHFKAVNDRFGHAAGDALLIAVASRLRGSVRDEDTVARLGGDEFAIILYDTVLPDDTLIVVEKIIQDLHQPFVLDGYELPAHASIGIALYPDDSVGMETLLKFADIAMYRAKSGGGNGFHFHRQRGLAARFSRSGAKPTHGKRAV
jgi:diguanylate cyclase (GGDEF)-like protein/PAS domain S-box-containing protein